MHFFLLLYASKFLLFLKETDMKWSRPLEKQKLDLVKGLPEISSWFISVRKKKNQKNNNNKKTTPKPLRALLWVINCWVIATCVCVGTRFKVDGFLEDTEWVLCNSCEACRLDLACPQPRCRGSHSVCSFHCVMSSFRNVLAIAKTRSLHFWLKSEGMWQFWPGSM